MNGSIPFAGRIAARKISAARPSLSWRIRNTFRPAFLRGWLAVHLILPLARAAGLMTAYGTLSAVLWRFTSEDDRADYLRIAGALARAVGSGADPRTIASLREMEAAALAKREPVRYGVLSYRVITTAFVNFLASQFQTDTTEVGDFKYHDSGVGVTAEAVGNTAMETTDGESRVSGTQVASTNTYTSVATIAYTSTKAITEHGVFSSLASTTLLDRSLFAALNVVSGDSIQFTYVLTLTAGG